MTETLQVRRGTEADKATVISLIDEAAAWLDSLGIDQWARPWPTRAKRDERVVNGLRSGDTWMVQDSGLVIGTITYRSSGNEDLWTSVDRAEPAVYISRLMVTRSYAGLGIGSSLIDWAGKRAARAWDAQWIRVDVWTTNEALHNYYEKRGFDHVRICGYDRETYPSSALFQKPITEIDGAAEARFTSAYGVS